MWQTAIMESLKEVMVRAEGSPTGMQIYLSIMKSVYNFMPIVTTYHFGDVNSIETGKLDNVRPLFEQFPEYNKFPSHLCLFEGNGFGATYQKSTTYQAKKRAIFIDSSPNFAEILLFHCVDSEALVDEPVRGRWIMEPFLAIMRIGEGNECDPDSYVGNIVKIVEKSPQYDPLLQDIYTLGMGEMIPVKLIPNYPDELKDTWIRDARPDITFLKEALLLMHCRNVIREKVEPSEKLNHKRVKNNKLPFYSYHILKVMLPGKGTEVRLGGQPTGASQRLNLCRGHFKHYTAEKPLFGKYAGLYWWDEFVRGDRDKGMIDKEYKIVEGKK